MQAGKDRGDLGGLARCCGAGLRTLEGPALGPAIFSDGKMS